MSDAHVVAFFTHVQVAALSQQFFEGQRLYQRLNSSFDSSSPAYQGMVQRALAVLLELHYRVQAVSVFSKNEGASSGG